jgi:hypothetical protein
MGGLGDKPIGDLVLLAFITMLGAMLLIAAAGLIVLAIVRPDLDLTSAINQFGNVMSVMTGAVLGYVAGRRAAAIPLPNK